MFTGAQEAAIVNMVLANCIRLREIQANIINDDNIFNNIQRVSLSTLGRILKKNQIYMKQLYRVPFDRNSERVKHLRNEYVEVCILHLTIYNGVVLCTAHNVPSQKKNNTIHIE